MQQPKRKSTEGPDTCDGFCFNEKLVNRLQGVLPDEKTVQRTVDFFAALGSRTRLLVLFCLACSDELCVCDLANALDMNLSTISHQLRHLRGLELVECRRDGKMVFYRLSDPRIEEILHKEFQTNEEVRT